MAEPRSKMPDFDAFYNVALHYFNASVMLQCEPVKYWRGRFAILFCISEIFDTYGSIRQSPSRHIWTTHDVVLASLYDRLIRCHLAAIGKIFGYPIAASRESGRVGV